MKALLYQLVEALLVLLEISETCNLPENKGNTIVGSAEPSSGMWKNVAAA